MIIETANESLSTTNDDIKASVAFDVWKDCDLTSRMLLNIQYLCGISCVQIRINIYVFKSQAESTLSNSLGKAQFNSNKSI